MIHQVLQDEESKENDETVTPFFGKEVGEVAQACYGLQARLAVLAMRESASSLVVKPFCR